MHAKLCDRIAAELSNRAVRQKPFGALANFNATVPAIRRRFFGYEQDYNTRVARRIADLCFGTDLPFASQSQRHFAHRSPSEVRYRDDDHITTRRTIQSLRQRIQPRLRLGRKHIGKVVHISHRRG